jgi:hypothetical protein
VLNIDNIRREVINFQKGYSLPTATVIGMWMAMDDMDVLAKRQLPGRESRLLTTRRNILRLFGLGAWGSAYVAHHSDALDKDRRPEEYSGYITRGRSAKMMENILAVARQFPDARISVITGDAHAQLFELYFRDPGLLARDLRTYWIFNEIYEKGVHEILPEETEV